MMKFTAEKEMNSEMNNEIQEVTLLLLLQYICLTEYNKESLGKNRMKSTLTLFTGHLVLL